MKKRDADHSLLLNLAHFVLVAVIAVAVEETLKGEIQKHIIFVAALLIVLAQILVFYLIYQISNRIDDITPRVGVRTSLLDFPDAYKEAEKAVKNAKEEILVVSNMALPFQFKPTAETDRKSYFSMLVEEVTKRPEITYERIVQMSSSAGESKGNFPVLLPHLRECIQIRDEKAAAIGIFSCQPSVLVSFLLIDSTWVLLQLDEFDNRTKRFQVGKGIILEDSAKKLTPVFKKIFGDLMRVSHSMTIAELDEIEKANVEPTKLDVPSGPIPS
jgi:hypothetical protein